MSKEVTITITRKQLDGLMLSMYDVNAFKENHGSYDYDSAVVELFIDSLRPLRTGEYDGVNLVGYDFASSCLEQ